MLATHNSGTGEPSKNLIHKIISPFSKCQDKNIVQQLEAGVRYFDLRVNKNLQLCHGLWESVTSLEEAIRLIDVYPETVYYRVVIERQNANHLASTILDITKKYKHARLTELIEKKPVWKVLLSYRKIPVRMNFISVPTPKEYLTLAYKDWRRYIPIPRILNKFAKPEFDENTFTMVDFV